MTLPSRIELAARAIDPGAFDAEAWRRMQPDMRGFFLAQKHAFETAERILNAAFPDAPGLFSDSPQVWLAPIKATDAMASAIWDCPRDEAERAWAAFRDAHLSPQSDKPEKGEAK